MAARGLTPPSKRLLPLKRASAAAVAPAGTRASTARRTIGDAPRLRVGTPPTARRTDRRASSPSRSPSVEGPQERKVSTQELRPRRLPFTLPQAPPTFVSPKKTAAASTGVYASGRRAYGRAFDKIGTQAVKPSSLWVQVPLAGLPLF